MKVAVFSALVAAVFAQQLDLDFDKGKTRAEVGHQVVPGGTAPSKQELLPRFTNYHADVKRTKVRYGPYRLPSTKEVSLMSAISGEPGTMSSIATGMQKPCTGSCGLITAQAGLEYPNGTVADNSNGSWLHHIVLITGGPGHSDGTCPGMGVGLIGERTFSSGNERTPTAFGDVISGKVKSAFPLKSGDVFSAQLELMNLNTEVKNVYLTIDYEYVPGALPADFKRARAMWLDITGCGISSVNPPAGKKAFKMDSRKWTVGYTGQMLGVGGHLHDGGTVLNVYKNSDNICASKATYGMGAGMDKRSVSKRQAGGMAMESSDGKQHIASMSTCSLMGPVTKKDQIWIDAEYNFNDHEGMTSPTGAYTEIMGIAIMYLAQDK